MAKCIGVSSGGIGYPRSFGAGWSDQYLYLIIAIGSTIGWRSDNHQAGYSRFQSVAFERARSSSKSSSAIGSTAATAADRSRLRSGNAWSTCAAEKSASRFRTDD